MENGSVQNTEMQSNGSQTKARSVPIRDQRKGAGGTIMWKQVHLFWGRRRQELREVHTRWPLFFPVKLGAGGAGHFLPVRRVGTGW